MCTFVRCFMAAVLVSVAALAHAQQVGGSAIQGRVIDDQGAVLPGVSVVVTHQDSGTFRETTTGVDGTWFVTGIPPGRYRVAADLQGFKKFQQDDINLVLGSTATVEVKLEVGGFTETITVSGEVPQVDLTSAQVGGNVASQEITELPSPTRNFIAFVAMLPGVQLNPSAEGSDSLSINGQSNNQVNFVLDGGNNTDDNSASASGAQARTPLEAVQEFQVVTNQFDVEFGRTTGGVVNAITKRGTNSFRGSAFGYLTNSAMTAPNYFAKQANLEEGDTDKHQWGGTIGGPILRNKMHFFYSFERYVIGGAITNTFATRPDLNLTTQQGLNGYNHMIRVDGQINSNNTYTARYLTERQPNRDLYTGETATATTANYELDEDQTASFSYNRVIGHRGVEHAARVGRDRAHPPRRRAGHVPRNAAQGSRGPGAAPSELRSAGPYQRPDPLRLRYGPGRFTELVPSREAWRSRSQGRLPVPVRAERSERAGQRQRRLHVRDRSRLQRRRSVDVSGAAVDSRAGAGRAGNVCALDRALLAGQVAGHQRSDHQPRPALGRRHRAVPAAL